MSLSYAEIYQAKLKNRNKNNKEETINESRSPKYITLIKKFPSKQRKINKNDEKMKPRRIESKSVQIIQKYRKTVNHKNKINTKKSIEEHKNEKEKKPKKYIKNGRQKQNNRNKSNNNGNLLEEDKFYETDIHNNFFSETKNEKEKQKKNKINKYCTFQQNDDNKFFELETYDSNKFNNINKNQKYNSLDNYFTIFRYRQYAANFKDKFNNANLNLNKFNSYNDMNKYFNLDKNNNNTNNSIKQQKAQTNTESIPKKSKTYYRALKLKEEFEKPISNNIHNKLYSSCNNWKEKNNINKDKKNNNDKNTFIGINQNFFVKDGKRPKILNKYMTQNFNIISSQIDKNKNDDKNMFRTYFIDKNENSKVDDNIRNNLIDKFSSEIYQNKYKRKFKYDNKNLNLIVQENTKLNKMLKKIPSNKDNKDKSLDLIKYILQIRKKDDKIISNNNKYYSYNGCINNLEIFPTNEWEPIAKLKHEIFK